MNQTVKVKLYVYCDYCGKRYKLDENNNYAYPETWMDLKGVNWSASVCSKECAMNILEKGRQQP